MIVGGKLTSQERYFEQLKHLDWTGGEWSTIAARVAEDESDAKKRKAEINQKAEAEGVEHLTPEEKEEYQDLRRRLIHLENATVVGLSNQPISVAPWRGSLLDVIGWNFGGVGVSQ